MAHADQQEDSTGSKASTASTSVPAITPTKPAADEAAADKAGSPPVPEIPPDPEPDAEVVGSSESDNEEEDSEEGASYDPSPRRTRSASQRSPPRTRQTSLTLASFIKKPKPPKPNKKLKERILLYLHLLHRLYPERQFALAKATQNTGTKQCIFKCKNTAHHMTFADPPFHSSLAHLFRAPAFAPVPICTTCAKSVETQFSMEATYGKQCSAFHCPRRWTLGPDHDDNCGRHRAIKHNTGCLECGAEAKDEELEDCSICEASVHRAATFGDSVACAQRHEAPSGLSVAICATCVLNKHKKHFWEQERVLVQLNKKHQPAEDGSDSSEPEALNANLFPDPAREPAATPASANTTT